jgi:predicted phage tail protein
MRWRRLLVRAWVGVAIIGSSFFAGVFFTAGRGGNHLVDWLLFALAATLCLSGIATLAALLWPCATKNSRTDNNPERREPAVAVKSR